MYKTLAVIMTIVMFEAASAESSQKTVTVITDECSKSIKAIDLKKRGWILLFSSILKNSSIIVLKGSVPPSVLVTAWMTGDDRVVLSYTDGLGMTCIVQTEKTVFSDERVDRRES